jgi:hypothetical protein
VTGARVTQHEKHQHVAHHDVRTGSERSFGIVFGVGSSKATRSKHLVFRA